MTKIKRIGISTGGGDAPGLNAVIRAIVLAANNRGWESYGIRDGYDGLMHPENFPDGGLIPLDRNAVRGLTHRGGTIIGTTNRGHPFAYPVEDEDGTVREVDISDRIFEGCEKHGLDAIVAIGGDGSLDIANRLSKKGLTIVGVPKTIDNDLDQTVATFGFNTAVSVATEAIDRLHSTAESHRRIMVIEVMGRYAGWIALESGVAGSADAIIIPEIPYDINKIADKVLQREKNGRRFSIIVVAEGAKPIDGEVSIIGKSIGQAERLGGIGHKLGAQLEELTGKESRVVVLGHLLRGGGPTAYDRLISLRFGAAAVRALDEGHSGIMVALDPPKVNYVPLDLACQRMKSVPLDCDTILTARDLGTALGD